MPMAFQRRKRPLEGPGDPRPLKRARPAPRTTPLSAAKALIALSERNSEEYWADLRDYFGEAWKNPEEMAEHLRSSRLEPHHHLKFDQAEKVGEVLGLEPTRPERTYALIQNTWDADYTLQGHARKPGLRTLQLWKKGRVLDEAELLRVASPRYRDAAHYGTVLYTRELGLHDPEVMKAERDLGSILFGAVPNARLAGHLRGLVAEGVAGSSILEALAELGVAFINGSAGVGKTTHARSVIEHVKGARGSVSCVAYTHAAALQLARATGHPATTAHAYYFGPKGGRPSPHVLVVDEISMLGSVFFRNLLAKEPWSALVLLGDRKQLPPIDRGDALRVVLETLPSRAICTLYKIHRTVQGSGVMRATCALLKAVHRVEVGHPAANVGKELAADLASVAGDPASGVVWGTMNSCDEVFGHVDAFLAQNPGVEWGRGLRGMMASFRKTTQGGYERRLNGCELNHRAAKCLDMVRPGMVLIVKKNNLQWRAGQPLHNNALVSVVAVECLPPHRVMEVREAQRAAEIQARNARKEKQKAGGVDEEEVGESARPCKAFKGEGAVCLHLRSLASNEVVVLDAVTTSAVYDPDSVMVASLFGLEYGYFASVHASQGIGVDYVVACFDAVDGQSGWRDLYTALTRAKRGILLFITESRLGRLLEKNHGRCGEFVKDTRSLEYVSARDLEGVGA
jgi:hypothetical protein